MDGDELGSARQEYLLIGLLGNNTKYLPLYDNENRLDLNCQVPHSTLRFAELCEKQAKWRPWGSWVFASIPGDAALSLAMPPSSGQS